MRVRLRHERLAEILAKSNQSQNRWAQRLGLSPPHLSMLVNGKRPYPSAATRVKLLRGLKVPFEDLFQPELPNRRPIPLMTKRPRRHSMRSIVEADGRRPSLGLGMARDVRFALRKILKRPASSILMIVTLALGIGAVTSIFSVVNGVLLRPLPFTDPDRLVLVWSRLAESGTRDSSSLPDYSDLVDNVDAFDGTGGMGYPTGASLTGESEPLQIKLSLITPGFFSVLGIEPELGREFGERDALTRTATVGVFPDIPIILSHSLWQSRFGGQGDIVGKKIVVNNVPAVVVGVMPNDLRFFQLLKSAGLGIKDSLDGWLPVSRSNPIWPRTMRLFRIVGRLKASVGLDAAQAQTDALSKRLRETYPYLEAAGFRFEVAPLREDLLTHVRPALAALAGAVGFVLLIACANVANILLARALTRSREISVRVALGAARSVVVRQLLIESLVLAISGASLGLLMAGLGIRVLLALQPAHLPRIDEIAIDSTVLTFTLAAAVGAAILFGLMPALRMSRPGLFQSIDLKGRGGPARMRSRAQASLVVAQVALSLVLLIGAGLMLRSFANLQQTSLGFDPDNAMAMNIAPPGSRYPTLASRVDLYMRLETELAARPEIAAGGGVLHVPLAGGWWTGPYWLPRDTAAVGQNKHTADYRTITPGYFDAIGTPLIDGRAMTEQEYREPRPVVIVDEVFARQAWPDWPAKSALGRTIRILPEQVPAYPNPLEMRVIAVARHVRHDHPGIEGRPTVYFPAAYTTYTTFMDFVVRARPGVDPRTAIREAVRKLDPDLPIANLRTISSYVQDALAPMRFSLFLIGLFAAISLVLALVGLYGVVSFGVSRRVQEIGLRMALGAHGSQIVRFFVGQALRMTIAGTGIGILGAVALTQVLSGSLHGVSPLDPVTFAAVAALLQGVSLAACYFPARRATRVDPMAALRTE